MLAWCVSSMCMFVQMCQYVCVFRCCTKQMNKSFNKFGFMHCAFVNVQYKKRKLFRAVLGKISIKYCRSNKCM